MPRPCTVCQHPERVAIDRELVEGQPFRRIASRFDLSEISVRRHKQAHLPQVLALGVPVEELATADDLRAKLRRYETKCWTILQQAESRQLYTVALAAIGRLTTLLLVDARVTRELAPPPAPSLVESSEWQQMRGVLLELLQPYPELRGKISRAMLAIAPSDGHGPLAQ